MGVGEGRVVTPPTSSPLTFAEPPTTPGRLAVGRRLHYPVLAGIGEPTGSAYLLT